MMDTADAFDSFVARHSSRHLQRAQMLPSQPFGPCAHFLQQWQ